MPVARRTSEGVEVTFSASEIASATDADLTGVKQQFKTQEDERVRPEHAALNNTVWDADDPNAPVPPLGPGCRCYLQFFADDKETAEATGMDVVPRGTPEPGKEALEEFWDVSEQSDESTDPGGAVTPVDTFGATTGKAIEERKVTPDEAFDPDSGDTRPATEVSNLAKAKDQGRSKSSVIAATAQLQGLALTASTQRRIVKLANDLKKANPGKKDEQYLFEAVMKLKPGLVGIRNTQQTRTNARKAAKQIRRAFGPLDG